MADTSTWFLPQLFGWVSDFFGGDATVRQIHHVATWSIMLFIVAHIYIVMYHDYVEGNGEVSSMFSGWKFIHQKHTAPKNQQAKVKEEKEQSKLTES